MSVFGVLKVHWSTSAPSDDDDCWLEAEEEEAADANAAEPWSLAAEASASARPPPIHVAER